MSWIRPTTIWTDLTGASGETDDADPHTPARVVFSTLVGILLLTLLGIALTGCNQERIDRLETRADSLRDTLDAAVDRAEMLRAENTNKDQRIQAATELIGGVLDRLSQIARQEEILRESIQQAAAGAESVENLPTPDEVRSEMQTYLSAIERHLRESRQTIAQLQERTSEQESQITSMTETVDRLEGMLDRREQTLTDLRSRIDTLAGQLSRARARNETLTDRNEQLSLRTESMSRAYVVVADKDSLDAAGIVNDRFLRSTELRSLDPSKFTPVEVGTTRIDLPRQRDGAKVFSVHSRAPELYEFDGDQLRIREPDRFWAISRFLIVEIDQ